MFKHYSAQRITETQNGATALKTTGNDLLDYFTMLTRTLTKEQHNDYLEKCWKIDPVTTIAIIFHARDRLKGKKEKKVSNEGMLWLRNNYFETYKLNIRNYVDKYGRWKDLLYITYNLKKASKEKDYELSLFSEQLRLDEQKLSTTQAISLCAKWAPSENDRNDKRKHMAKRLASIIYSKDDPKKMEKYRTLILTPLRSRIKIIESLMCSNQWDQINYPSVPGVASKKFLNAFMKHDEVRYKAYLESVRKGEKEIKITGLLPHELMSHYIKTDEKNETIELQWKTMLEKLRSTGVLNGGIPLVDLSGSMFSASNGDIPARVAASLGILTSLCCKEPFYGKVITFSADPELLTLKNESLYDCYTQLTRNSYGLDTNFEKACQCIIDYGLKHNISDKDMPKKIFVFTDMQFNKASKTYKTVKLLYAHIVKLFRTNHYTPPKFIFWNLNSDHEESFPIDCSTDGTAIVSGFSEQTLKMFMEFDDFQPDFIMRETLKPYIPDVHIHESDMNT
jgi:hypothetical protein